MTGTVKPRVKTSDNNAVSDVRSNHPVDVSVEPWFRKQSSNPSDDVPAKFVLSTEFAGRPVQLPTSMPLIRKEMRSWSKFPGHVSPSRAVKRA